MNRATSVEMRKALQAVELMKEAGLRFVPMPALDDHDHAELVAKMQKRLDEMADRCEG